MITALNAADWHAAMALKAYRRRDYETYTRHIHIADDLRYQVAFLRAIDNTGRA
ncbi:hypothetical protein J2R95_003141 [Bradyrhizobium japonicum]|jgi:hypothetical protein|uniref:hypothetical protein n=1 Tax=Bradyrhizobium japonicum TaxID=375 RepID=UPI00209E9967|nr:hypothetical protein [Bradyrhizobium japonicum]MCP1937346.1 hypothetical protein [Bradyrhizobium japonicum]